MIPLLMLGLITAIDRCDQYSLYPIVAASSIKQEGKNQYKNLSSFFLCNEGSIYLINSIAALLSCKFGSSFLSTVRVRFWGWSWNTKSKQDEATQEQA